MYIYISEIFIQNSHELRIDLNVKENCRGMSAFYLACANGHDKVVQMMLNHIESVEDEYPLEPHHSALGFFGKLKRLSCIIYAVTGAMSLVIISISIFFIIELCLSINDEEKYCMTLYSK